MGRLRVLSRDHLLFADRTQAGDWLAELLAGYRGGDTIILGIPRGGVIVADRLANRLGADMNVVLSHKIHAEQNPDLVIGSVAEDGRIFLQEDVISWVQPQPEYMEQESLRQVESMREERRRYRTIRPRSPLSDRTVIVTDDGVATGATLEAALWTVRYSRPRRLIVALPLGPESIIDQLSEQCDEVACVSVPSVFNAIGESYERFEEVDEATVLRLIRHHHHEPLEES